MLGGGGSWVGSSSGAVAAAFNPTTTFTLFEDFSTGIYSGTGQIFGDNIWAAVATSTGSGTGQGVTIPSDNGHPGIFEMSTGANSAGGFGITAGVNGGTVTQAFLAGNGQTTFEALINYPVLSNGTDNTQIDCGFRDGPGWSGSSNQICIQYQKESSAFWRMFTTAASTTTTVTSAVTATIGWHHIKIVINAAGTSVEGFVDGVSLGTSSTNIPSTKLPPLISARKTLGTTPMYLGIDYIKIDKTFTTPR